MPRITLGLSILLIALGIIGYVASGMVSLTALIPAIPGLVFLVLAVLALVQPATRKHVMHVAMAFALLVAVLMVGMLVMAALSEDGFARPAAAGAQAVMGLLCVVYIAPGVRSFRAARLARGD